MIHAFPNGGSVEKVDMCVAIQEMMADSRAEGRIEGKNAAILRSLRSLMCNLGFSISQAMDALSIPPEEREQYEARLNKIDSSVDDLKRHL